ncbi:hypothetical protein F25303_8739 [Fusarium sp. NRRL 25303]|nr:hypothetical protein F25303_8739 [Fusarium sp. NRRL 25303]
MGNNPSHATGHYRAGPQYQAPPTHFSRGHTLRETQHFKGGYTLRDPPKKKKMGLVGVPEYTPQSLSPRHSRLSTGRNGLAAAAAQTAYSPPAQQQYYSSPQQSRTTGLGSRAVPQHNFSQPARQHFSHGHSLRNNPQLSKKKKNWKW